MVSRKRGALYVLTGYVLSPLSWWNDLYVNVPIAYLFSIPFTLIRESLFMPAFIVGYWLSNLVGLLLFDRGCTLLKGCEASLSWRRAVITTTLYSLILIVLIWYGWFPSPTELAKMAGR